MKTKHTSGIMNPIAIFCSPIHPISIGENAPPATAIVRNDAARLVYCPIRASPSAYIVGNMIDIKKKLMYSAYNDILPKPNTTNIMATVHTAA